MLLKKAITVSTYHMKELYEQLIGVLDKGVWSEKDGEFLSDKIEENAITFLVSFLNKIEDTAKSRGDYRLQDWL